MYFITQSKVPAWNWELSLMRSQPLIWDHGPPGSPAGTTPAVAFHPSSSGDFYNIEGY